MRPAQFGRRLYRAYEREQVVVSISYGVMGIFEPTVHKMI
jgi:hypothetical protein